MAAQRDFIGRADDERLKWATKEDMNITARESGNGGS
jgi:hypothetical protein